MSTGLLFISADPIQATGYHVTCGDVQSKINTDVAQARAAIISGFDGLVADDAKQLEADLSGLLHAVSINSAAAE